MIDLITHREEHTRTQRLGEEVGKIVHGAYERAPNLVDLPVLEFVVFDQLHADEEMTASCNRGRPATNAPLSCSASRRKKSNMFVDGIAAASAGVVVAAYVVDKLRKKYKLFSIEAAEAEAAKPGPKPLALVMGTGAGVCFVQHPRMLPRSALCVPARDLSRQPG